MREQDAGIYGVDAITTGNLGQVINELLGKGRIYNYVPAHYIDRIPVENRVPLSIRVNEEIVFFYNTESYSDGAPVTNVWELTEDRFKGRIGIKYPMASGSSLMGIASLVQHPVEMAAAYMRLTGEDIVLSDGVPDAGYEFVARLLANDLVIFKSGSKLADAAAVAGQHGADGCDIWLSGTGYVTAFGCGDADYHRCQCDSAGSVRTRRGTGAELQLTYSP